MSLTSISPTSCSRKLVTVLWALSRAVRSSSRFAIGTIESQARTNPLPGSIDQSALTDPSVPAIAGLGWARTPGGLDNSGTWERLMALSSVPRAVAESRLWDAGYCHMRKADDEDGRGVPSGGNGGGPIGVHGGNGVTECPPGWRQLS